MAQGHPNAAKYPLSKLWMEVELARERVNQQTVTEATLMHAVISAVLSPKNGQKHLDKLLRDIADG